LHVSIGFSSSSSLSFYLNDFSSVPICPSDGSLPPIITVLLDVDTVSFVRISARVYSTRVEVALFHTENVG
jgi:hypothetical protein